MAELTLKTRLLNKYNQAIASDHVLGAGEINFVEVAVPLQNGGTTTAVLMKVGDGKTAYGALDYVAAKAADVFSWAKEENLTVEKSGTGNVVSGIEWDASLNEGKGGLKFTTAAVATSEGLNDLQERVAAIENAYLTEDEINGLVEGLNAEINKKANAADVYTKTEADGKYATSATVTAELAKKVDTKEGYSLVADTEIARLAAINNYDDTGIKADIAANAEAASDAQTAAEEAKASIVTTNEQVAALDTKIGNETARATAAEQANATAIEAISGDYLKAADKTELSNSISEVKTTADAAKSAIDAFLDENAVTEGAVDTLKEIQAQLDAGEASAASLLADINTLKAIDNATQEELDTAVAEINDKINSKVDETDFNALAAKVDVEKVSEAITAGNNTTLTSANSYTDTKAAETAAAAATDAQTKADAALAAAKAYADENDSDTTYTASTGLKLEGTVFSIDPELILILDANQ